MNRRRILTGLVAAPFVARLGILMPVRSIVPVQESYWSLCNPQPLRWGFDPSSEIPIVYGYVTDAGEVDIHGSELDWPITSYMWPGVGPKVLVQR